nr:hypothetical protein [Tanacetum cinerariifolium]
MANLSSADPITNEAGPSYDSDIPSEVRNHDQYLDDNCAYQEEHVMHDSVQLDHIVDLHADHTSISNMIPYDQYVKDIDVSVVHSNASSVSNDTFMIIYDEMCEPIAPSVSNSSRNAVVKNSLTAELATYREQVELYERWAKFELTEREQKINEQLRLVISDRNFKEETLKREIHSTKLQLTSTINRNKSMMKSLKEKVEDRLVKQDQSLQTVHMLCRPRLLYNDLNKVAIGYKNPLCLTRAKQAQPALYNGHEILKDNHARAKVHNTEDTLEIVEITRKKMNAKITDPETIDPQTNLLDLALNVDNVFQAEDCDSFDSDVDEAPTAQTMFMANLSSADPITDEAGPSYDSDILSEENKLLKDFLNMKSLKEKVEDRLVKQDQSLQTVHMLCRPRPLYNDLNKVAIGYKNPLCLTRAKQAQPALYNGHEILKDNHARAKVHNTEDTLKIAEITRMTDPECVTHKVKIAPHDYSKENLLATFTPQKQLTAEQIYWSNDLMTLKSKTHKERAKVSRPIKAFTVYPPNTPATLVPRVLPTTSQVKIHIFTLIQQF